MYIEVNSIQDKYDLYGFLKKMRFPYYVAIGSIFQKRSLKQNKGYHKYILVALAREIGKTKEEVERELLIACACVESYRDEDGNMVYICEHTSDMTTMRFIEYTDDCKDYAMDKYNVYLLNKGEIIEEMLDFHGKTRKIIVREDD